MTTNGPSQVQSLKPSFQREDENQSEKNNNNDSLLDSAEWKIEHEECEKLESNLKELVKPDNSNVLSHECDNLREKLQGKYLKLLSSNYKLSVEHDIMLKLWKFIFYRRIEFCRKILRKVKDSVDLSSQQKHKTILNNLTKKCV